MRFQAKARARPRQFKPIWNAERGVWESKLLEEHVLKEIVERLWLHARIKVVRINCPVGGKVRPNEPGIPDLIGYLPDGKFLGIEVKRPGGARRPAQERFISDASASNCLAFFAESWYDVARELTMAGVKLCGS